MKEYYDVIIVGTRRSRFILCFKSSGTETNIINYKTGGRSIGFLPGAGGICMLRGEDDYQNYFEDTMRAGHYENNARSRRSDDPQFQQYHS